MIGPHLSALSEGSEVLLVRENVKLIGKSFPGILLTCNFSFLDERFQEVHFLLTPYFIPLVFLEENRSLVF